MVTLNELRIAVKFANALGIANAGDVEKGADLVAGARKGATGRALGVEELGVKLANALGVETGDLREALADAQRQNAAESVEGVSGFIGELIGDPVSYIPGGTALKGGRLAKAVRLAASGAASGGVAGITEGTQDQGSDLGDNLSNAGTGAAIGGTIGTAVPFSLGTGKILYNTGRGTALRTGAAFGNDKAANKVAADILASKLDQNGFSPEEIKKAVEISKNSSLNPTLGESTQSPGILGIEKTILKGDDKAARTMRDAVYNRNVNTIPDAVRAQAAPLSVAGADAGNLYRAAAQEAQNPSVLAQQTTFNDVQTMKQQIKDRLSQLGDVNNVERKTLDQANTIIKNAEQRGNTFEALHDAKKQLANIFIEGGDTTIQQAANRVSNGFRQGIDKNLSDLAPINFKAADQASQQGMAARELTDALQTSNEGGVRQLYNKVWKTPEMREEFLRKIPQSEHGAFKDFFADLEKVSRGHAGSDTAFNFPAGKSLESSMAGFDMDSFNLMKTAGNLFKSLTDFYTPGIKDKVARLALNPDSRITDSLVRQGRSVLDNPLMSPAIREAAIVENRKSPVQQPETQDDDPFAHLIPSSQTPIDDDPFAHLIPQGRK